MVEAVEVNMKIRETMSPMNEINSLEAKRYVKAKDYAPEERVSIPPDQVNVSEAAVERARFTRVLGTVMSTPDVDYNRVAELRKAIAEGTYKPEAKDVAQKIAEEWTFYASLYAAGGDDHGEA